MTSSCSGSIKPGVTEGFERAGGQTVCMHSSFSWVQEKKVGNRTGKWWVEVEAMFSVSSGSHIRCAEADKTADNILQPFSLRTHYKCGQPVADPSIRIQSARRAVVHNELLSDWEASQFKRRPRMAQYRLMTSSFNKSCGSAFTTSACIRGSRIRNMFLFGKTRK